jgi:hypothetical protein
MDANSLRRKWLTSKRRYAGYAAIMQVCAASALAHEHREQALTGWVLAIPARFFFRESC